MSHTSYEVSLKLFFAIKIQLCGVLYIAWSLVRLSKMYASFPAYMFFTSYLFYQVLSELTVLYGFALYVLSHFIMLRLRLIVKNSTNGIRVLVFSQTIPHYEGYYGHLCPTITFSFPESTSTFIRSCIQFGFL